MKIEISRSLLRGRRIAFFFGRVPLGVYDTRRVISSNGVPVTFRSERVGYTHCIVFTREHIRLRTAHETLFDWRLPQSNKKITGAKHS